MVGMEGAMAFKLAKDKAKSLTELAELLSQKHVALEEAVDEYNEVLGKARDHMVDIVSAWEEQFSDMSDGWKEGERGEVVQEFINRWTECIEGMSDFEDVPECPTEAILELDHESE
jgi:hypothetical protein